MSGSRWGWRGWVLPKGKTGGRRESSSQMSAPRAWWILHSSQKRCQPGRPGNAGNGKTGQGRYLPRANPPPSNVHGVPPPYPGKGKYLFSRLDPRSTPWHSNHLACGTPATGAYPVHTVYRLCTEYFRAALISFPQTERIRLQPCHGCPQGEEGGPPRAQRARCGYSGAGW